MRNQAEFSDQTGPFVTLPTSHTGKITAKLFDAEQFAAMRPAWRDLVARAAEPNAFMDPGLVKAAADTNPDIAIQVAVASQSSSNDSGPRLIGAWAFAIERPRKSPLPLRMLVAPVHLHGHLATPLVDRDHADAALAGMLDAVAASQGPKIIALDAMGTGGATMAALLRVLERRGSPPCIFEQAQRPKLASALDGESYLKTAMSSGSRKKLRQHRRRLGEQGTLTRITAADPATLARSIEEFLTLEAAGWKGREGTAFLSNPAQAAFMRAAVMALAGHGALTIDQLAVDNRPVSMQIVLRCGVAAFTWKTTFDERFQHFSPGMLLLEDYTASFLADPAIAFVDSCAQDDTGFMSVWAERQGVADLWLDARQGGSLAFRSLSSLQKSYRELRASAKQAYHSARRAHKR